MIYMLKCLAMKCTDVCKLFWNASKYKMDFILYFDGMERYEIKQVQQNLNVESRL